MAEVRDAAPNRRLAPLRYVTSRDNATVKRLATLSHSAPARRRDGMCLLEGEHLAQSYAQRARIATLVLRGDEASAPTLSLADGSGGVSPHQLAPSHQRLVAASDETIVLAPRLFDQLSALSTSSGVLAMAATPVSPPLATRGFVLALDALQDPGNVGTLIRTAAAAGASQVWLSAGCAFAWSVKTLRASQGAHFHIDVIEAVELETALANFKGQRWATLPRPLPGMASSVVVHELRQAKFAVDTVMILSNEGNGLSPSLYGAVTHGLSIPMQNGIESLNVGVAGALALYAVAGR
ncbi:MAG: RNA methyltransferase [Betaproteobacteria bacterium]|nr:MAG: RNA methyltransferase [Betaproteobacteria bacterium]